MNTLLNLRENKHFYYWILPLSIISITIILGFSGIEVLQNIISPPINREFGLLENLQLVVIFSMLILSIRGLKNNNGIIENIGYALLILLFTFAFLEEIDYGIHYYEYFFKNGVEDKSMVRNFHNHKSNNFYVRRFINGVMGILFLILPLLKDKIKNSFIKQFCADKMIISSFMVYLVIGQLVRFLPKVGIVLNDSLRDNHQEFEELISYYIMFLYLYEFVYLKEAIFSTKEKIDKKLSGQHS